MTDDEARARFGSKLKCARLQIVSALTYLQEAHDSLAEVDEEDRALEIVTQTQFDLDDLLQKLNAIDGGQDDW